MGNSLRDAKVQAIVVVAAMALGCAHVRPSNVAPAPPSMANWANADAGAAIDLANWIPRDRDAARALLAWCAQSPVRAKQLAAWAIYNPDVRADVILIVNPDWRELRPLLDDHRSALEAFLQWCRNHPQASLALADRPNDLTWAAANIDDAYWNLANPIQ